METIRHIFQASLLVSRSPVGPAVTVILLLCLFLVAPLWE